MEMKYKNIVSIYPTRTFPNEPLSWTITYEIKTKKGISKYNFIRDNNNKILRFNSMKDAENYIQNNKLT